MIDLDGKGKYELIIYVVRACYGTTLRGHVVIAGDLGSGWRYLGSFGSPYKSPVYDGLEEDLEGSPVVIVEDETHHGWRILNTGPRWVWERLSGERDTYGGERHCWTPAPNHGRYQPDSLDRSGVHYEENAAGYFASVKIDEECPE